MEYTTPCNNFATNLKKSPRYATWGDTFYEALQFWINNVKTKGVMTETEVEDVKEMSKSLNANWRYSKMYEPFRAWLDATAWKFVPCNGNKLFYFSFDRGTGKWIIRNWRYEYNSRAHHNKFYNCGGFDYSHVKQLIKGDDEFKEVFYSGDD